MEKRGELIVKAELGFKRTNFAMNLLSSLAMNTLGLDIINGYYRNSSHLRGTDFTTDFLKSINITYNSPCSGLDRIPTKGGAIVVCNHPMGALDGILLIDMIGKIRPDTKFLGNFLLMRLQTLSDFFLPVNPFNNKSSKNISGIKKALEHLEQGGLLIVFPAGEVSTYQKSTLIEDKSWGKSIMKFIQKAEVPIVPIHINGKNSLRFHLSGKIHPILRTLQLPLELINKQNKSFVISVGNPIIVKRQKELGSLEKLTSYIRNNVYVLKHASENVQHQAEITNLEPLAEQIDKEILSSEIERLKPQTFLFESSSYEVHFVAPKQSDKILQEIAILREQTFRKVGEGTGKGLDTDNYDNTYHQLIMWDRSEKKIMGGYRIALGKEIIEKEGINGFYTNSLFHIDKNMESTLEKTLELGRSFITEDYQRKPISLMLLWRGIMYVLLKNSQYRYMLGPVSVSGEFHDISKRIIMEYLKLNHFNNTLAKSIKPRAGITGISTYSAASDIAQQFKSVELIDKLIKDIEPQGGIPVLIKKYLQLGGKILSFNVDKEFNNSLDAFIHVDITTIPKSTLEMLAKELDIDKVVTHFKNA